MSRRPHTPLEPGPLLAALERHGVRWVLTGSAALLLHGDDTTPNDLDVTPALDADNLRRVARLLAELGAHPHFDPRWPFPREACDAWTPEPPTAENLDHLFETPHGLLDIVPRLAGTYDELATRAVRIEHAGVDVLVASREDVLDTMHRAARKKDAPRLERLDTTDVPAPETDP